MILTYMLHFLVLLLLLAVVPFILIMLLKYLGNWNKRLTYQLCGLKGEIYIGSIGTVIHEASHLLMAIIFHHHIEEAQLLHYDSESQTLGKVSHSWNTRNFYENFGNLFIGIAPIFGNGLILILLSQWLLKVKWSPLLKMITQGKLSLNTLLQWLSTVDLSVTDWHLWAFIMISFSILCGGFDLSNADLENATAGLWGLLTIIILLAIGTTYFNGYPQLVNLLIYGMTIATVMTVYIMVLSILTTIIMKLMVYLTHGR